MKSNNSGLLLLALPLLGYWLGLTVFSATAKLIIGLAQPAAAELIVANSLSRCISPHAHMEEIKPAKLIQTCRVFFFMHFARICMLVRAHVEAFVSMCIFTCHAPFFSKILSSLVFSELSHGGFFFFFFLSFFLSLCPHGYIIEEDSSRVCCKIEGTRQRAEKLRLTGTCVIE